MIHPVEFWKWWFADVEGFIEIDQLWPRGLTDQGKWPAHRRAMLSTLWYKIPDDWDFIEADADRALHTLNQQGYGIFSSCAFYREMPPYYVDKETGVTQVHKTRGRDVYVAGAVGVWADFDDIIEETPEEAIGRLGVDPSMVVSSGGGIHAYWRFDQPWCFEGDNDRHEFRSILRGLAHFLGSDVMVASPSNTLRTPGTINTKPKREGASVEVKHFSDHTYPVSVFRTVAEKREKRLQNLTPLPEGARGRLPRYVQEYLTQGAAEGGRNRAVHAAARGYNDNGFTLSDALGDLLPRAMADGLDEREATSAIESAFRYAPGTPNVSRRAQNMLAVRGNLDARPE